MKFHEVKNPLIFFGLVVSVMNIIWGLVVTQSKMTGNQQFYSFIIMAAIITTIFILVAYIVYKKPENLYERSQLSPPNKEDLAKKEEIHISDREFESVKKNISKISDVEIEFKQALHNAYLATKNSNHAGAVMHLKAANNIFPGQWQILHNLAVELIRLGKKSKSIEFLIEAEAVCRSALYLLGEFPYGTFYNLARAQAASGNLHGLRETFEYMKYIKLPDNLEWALIEGDNDFEDYDAVKQMQEYKDLRKLLMDKGKQRIEGIN